MTDKVIDDIVEKSNTVFIPDDIMNSFPIWSYDIAEKVWAISNEVFGDNEMYSFQGKDVLCMAEHNYEILSKQ